MSGSAAAKLAVLELVIIDGVLTDALQVFAEPRPIGGCQTTAGGCSDKGAARSKKVGGRPFQYLDNEKSLTRKLNGFGTGRSARAQIR